MDPKSVTDARAGLDRQAASRFALRAEARGAKMAEVNDKGILAAAGVGHAVRRAMQLTVAEGRAAVVPITGTEAAPAAPSERPIETKRRVERIADRTLESIVGFNDTDQINFLEHGIRAGRSVCRLIYGGQPIGTGFMVAPNVVLTNHHVIPDASSAAGFVAQFDYELDADDNPMQPKRFNLDPDMLFVTSEIDAFDFSFVAVKPVGLSGESLAGFAWLPLNPSTDKILEGEPVVVIQHPQGREKQLCLFHSEMVDRVDQYIYYTTDTEIGSSGSPAFNRQWQLVGLHHASAPSGEKQRGVNTAANEGIRISAILNALQKADRVTGNPQKLFTLLSDPQTQASGRPQAPLVLAPAAQTPVTTLEGRTVIRTRPAGWYNNPLRSGYQAGFLGGFEIPLPKLPEGLADDVTKLADGSAELKYAHYSVVMSASRRLAWFSAVNINGASVQRLSRTDRDPDHPEPAKTRGGDLEAEDVWWFDNRIPTDAQVGAKIYDGTDFDYGHLTRRLDAVWGEMRELRIANDDTFHVTNCAPQAHQLNTVTWAKLEDAVLDAATRHGLKFTVITGPVLDPRDPVLLDVQCPTAYWKIIAYIERNNLVAMGFLQWQTDLVATIKSKLESLSELDAAEEWHVPISDIVRLTALDFGPLLDADVKAGQGRERLTESLVDRLVPSASA
ncbi:hypothetical protein B5V01_21700 [Mesorhizobium erdmanii]|uniref:Serine protease n=2 Tax=Mesorhizobium TaxID=68287 RepID=A0A3M9X1B4_9HYPH|nr:MULTISPECIES: DNA/RNA non-specific endonuclease [Mesorhizobium]RNJ41807.1 hypothetical protein DNR46_31905 [Mesorhizobium japonicum]RXT42850.1 hypothetical protein B5V01_21700 [Mesorhizobium erdmanii]